MIQQCQGTQTMISTWDTINERQALKNRHYIISGFYSYWPTQTTLSGHIGNILAVKNGFYCQIKPLRSRIRIRHTDLRPQPILQKLQKPPHLGGQVFSMRVNSVDI